MGHDKINKYNVKIWVHIVINNALGFIVLNETCYTFKFSCVFNIFQIANIKCIFVYQPPRLRNKIVPVPLKFSVFSLIMYLSPAEITALLKFVLINSFPLYSIYIIMYIPIFHNMNMIQIIHSLVYGYLDCL